MPNSDVLYVRMLISDLCHYILQSFGESFRLRLAHRTSVSTRRDLELSLLNHQTHLKVIPAVLKLSLASVVNVLPVIVNDQAGHFDIVLGQLVNGVENFLIRKPLAQSIPRACGMLENMTVKS